MTAVSSAIDKDRHLPGEVGIWVLIFGDLFAFTLLFIIFMYYRGAEPDVFVEAHGHMNQIFGAINTLLLLTSSWCVATGVQAARRGQGQLAANGFIVAVCCGLGFALVKYFEYGEKLRGGLTFMTNKFYHCYYMFTAIHLFHVTLGMVFLYLMARTARSGRIDAGKMRFMEAGASFWHMVDLLWIALFAFFYLVQ